MRNIVLFILLIGTMFFRTAGFSYLGEPSYNAYPEEIGEIGVTYLNEDDGIEYTISANPFLGKFVFEDVDHSSRILQSLDAHFLPLRKPAEPENTAEVLLFGHRVDLSGQLTESPVSRYVIRLHRILT